MHRREDRFRRLTSAVSTASDKGWPFLTAVHCSVPLMQRTERSREREERGLKRPCWADYGWWKHSGCQICTASWKVGGLIRERLRRERSQPCSNDKASFTLRCYRVMDPTSALLLAVMDAIFNIGPGKGQPHHLKHTYDGFQSVFHPNNSTIFHLSVPICKWPLLWLAKHLYIQLCFILMKMKKN